MLAAGVTAARSSTAERPLHHVLVDEYARSLDASEADAVSSETAQARYDAAREIQNALPLGTTRACMPLLRALSRYAGAEIRATEAFDRLDAARLRTATISSRSAASAVQTARASCDETGQIAEPRRDASLLEPASGNAFTGLVRVAAPRRAVYGEVLVNGRLQTRRTVKRGVFETHLTSAAGAISRLTVILTDASGRVLGRATARDVWLLPSTAFRSRPGTTVDAARSRRLASAATAFVGYSGLYVRNLAKGTTASWNDKALFPAASTVKLGVVAAALVRSRSAAQRDGIRHDVEAIGRWSSNLAANRLFTLIGGQGPAEAELRALGARSSTYTGEYRVGTATARASSQPPLVSRRVTTARDLGAIMATLVRVASERADRRDPATGLMPADARWILGSLLRSEKRGDNVGLFARSVPHTVPMAQKNGWISSARHTAAVIFTPRGPVVAVAVTYSASGVPLGRGERLGEDVMAVALDQHRR
jgi:beta-lactamase class A